MTTETPSKDADCGCYGPCGNPDCCERCAKPAEPRRSAAATAAMTDAFATEGLKLVAKPAEPPVDITISMAAHIGELTAENAALKAERDALKAEVMELKAQEAAGWDSATIAKLKAENAALKARVERYEDLIVAEACNYGECITVPHAESICKEARAIRARKEQEAAK